MPKIIEFLGDSRERLRDFPENAKKRVGIELYAVQIGLEPSDWKPMKSIGAGVREIRVRGGSGAFRVIYLATFPDCVLVLHAFQKKTRKTELRDMNIASKRLKEWTV